MGRAITALVVLLVVGCVVTPAASAETDVTFETLAPCAVLCPYFALEAEFVNLDAACEPSPETVPGSFDDVVDDVPNGAVAVLLFLRPNVDYDSFACRTEPNAFGSYLIDSGANAIDCGGVSVPPVFVPLPVGCGEFMQVPAAPFRGKQIVFRAFNFADGPTAEGTYGIIF